MKEDVLKFKGKVVDSKRGLFRVELENKLEILAYLSGSMRKNYVKVDVGDTVEVEVSPYDLRRGRIVWRVEEWKRAQK
jgi:translation initiation factor IF-1